MRIYLVILDLQFRTHMFLIDVGFSMKKLVNYKDKLFGMFNSKAIAIFFSLLISLMIAYDVSHLVIRKANENITVPLSYLYITYVITGFAAVCLIILVTSRYALSKRHN